QDSGAYSGSCNVWRRRSLGPTSSYPPPRSSTTMTNTLLKAQNSNGKNGQRGEAVVKFGVVGYGYWGPNVVRNLDRLEEAELVAVCDKSPAARRKVARAFPRVTVTDDAAQLMSSPDIDAICV